MTKQTLRAALLKLQGRSSVPTSQFTSAQRSVLDQFARQTGAVNCQRQGRGDVYVVCDRPLFAAYLADMCPQVEPSLAEHLPLRAQNIAYARDSKAGDHQHDSYYPLLKAVGAAVTWQRGERLGELALDVLTREFGAATLRIEPGDAWKTDQALWLVENQALFDRTDWLPDGIACTLLFYGGQLDGRLLSWLSARPRASRVVLFPDYDGVGLGNFARLYAQLGEACECWLMPEWESKLLRYGSNKLWRDTFPQFSVAVAQLPAYLSALTAQMRTSGLALEQEAVWLPAS